MADEYICKLVSHGNGLYEYEPTGTELVRCKDCKHRIVNEHYGEKGYMKLKAMCEYDTGDPFERGRCAENDEWFCADGVRMDESTMGQVNPQEAINYHIENDGTYEVGEYV